MVNTNGIAGEALKSYVERIERLNSEKATLVDDIKDIYADAKSTGFDPKIIRLVVKRRSMDKNDLAEQAAMLDLYESALANTPIERHIQKSTPEKKENGSVEKKERNAAADQTLKAEALDYIKGEKSISLLKLQRKFQIGYNRAALLIDLLLEEGFLGTPDKDGNRPVLEGK